MCSIVEHRQEMANVAAPEFSLRDRSVSALDNLSSAPKGPSNTD
jgi:hypothetical protein